ncbi:MAG: 6-carboxytetrahydropterin synthase QueD [bacterium]|nr:6-carboxytetrahydropterin synthase QueD [bacterium]
MILTKNFSFDSAHRLENHKGKCKNLHGHTYLLEVSVAGKINNKTGMIIDFGILKEVVNNLIIDKLDHHYLNDIIDNPTAENIIRWIWNILCKTLKKQGAGLFMLKLWETPTSSVTMINI